MANKDDIIAQQAQQIDDLLKRIADLELQLAKALENSSNSSKSPSSAKKIQCGERLAVEADLADGPITGMFLVA